MRQLELLAETELAKMAELILDNNVTKGKQICQPIIEELVVYLGKVLNYLNEHFDITNPEELKSLSIIFTAYIAWKHLWHIEHAMGMAMGR